MALHSKVSEVLLQAVFSVQRIIEKCVFVCLYSMVVHNDIKETIFYTIPIHKPSEDVPHTSFPKTLEQNVFLQSEARRGLYIISPVYVCIVKEYAGF